MRNEQRRCRSRRGFVGRRRCCDQEIPAFVIAFTKSDNRNGGGTRHAQNSLKRSLQRRKFRNLVQKSGELSAAWNRYIGCKARRRSVGVEKLQRDGFPVC